MLKALDRDPRAGRLDQLLRRFRAQERSMSAALADLQDEIEFLQREANFLRRTTPAEGERVLRRCSEMQLDYDLLAIELVHVRMAIAGTGDEIAEQRDRSLAGSLPPETRIGA